MPNTGAFMVLLFIILLTLSILPFPWELQAISPPEMQNQNRSSENSLDCNVKAFNIEDLGSGMWKVAPEMEDNFSADNFDDVHVT